LDGLRLYCPSLCVLSRLPFLLPSFFLSSPISPFNSISFPCRLRWFRSSILCTYVMSKQRVTGAGAQRPACDAYRVLSENPDDRDDEQVMTGSPFTRTILQNLAGPSSHYRTRVDDHRNDTRHGEVRHFQLRFLLSLPYSPLPSSPFLRITRTPRSISVDVRIRLRSTSAPCCKVWLNH